ncbi:hypothetical protein BJF78_31645 [Pseudonocardia sp. CNS-139]|nr:hypothetical protein BJF78_31645 [Pseudonocardia sp. CNS-139]
MPDAALPELAPATLPGPEGLAGQDVRSRVDELVAGTTRRVGLPPEHWPADVLAEYTETALAISVEWACRSPFYRDRLGSVDGLTLDEFRKLPFTYPAEVKGRLRDLLACSWDDLAQINLSSGTTAGPTTYVGYTAEDLRGDGARYAPGGLFAFERSDLVAVALPYDLATVGLSIHRDVQRQGAVVLPAGKGGSYGPPERLVQAMADLGVNTLFSTPSFAWYLAELFERTYPGHDLPIEHLRVGGEAPRPRCSPSWAGAGARTCGSGTAARRSASSPTPARRPCTTSRPPTASSRSSTSTASRSRTGRRARWS